MARARVAGVARGAISLPLPLRTPPPPPETAGNPGLTALRSRRDSVGVKGAPRVTATPTPGGAGAGELLRVAAVLPRPRLCLGRSLHPSSRSSPPSFPPMTSRCLSFLFPLQSPLSRHHLPRPQPPCLGHPYPVSQYPYTGQATHLSPFPFNYTAPVHPLKSQNQFPPPPPSSHSPRLISFKIGGTRSEGPTSMSSPKTIKVSGQKPFRKGSVGGDGHACGTLHQGGLTPPNPQGGAHVQGGKLGVGCQRG